MKISQKYRNSTLKILAFGLIVFGCKTTEKQEEGSDVKFYGTDSKRAEMTFETHVDIRLNDSQSALPADTLKKSMAADIDEHIRVQLTHMFGAFSVHTKPFDFATSPGIPRERPELKISKVEKSAKDVLRVTYKYKDITAFKKDVFNDPKNTNRSVGSRTIEFYIPEEPGPDGSTIYAKGCPGESSNGEMCTSGTNHCTDHHYNSQGDFWYFWDPFMNEGTDKSCTIKQKDLVKVSAKLRSLPSTRNTFPDYFKLYPRRGENRSLKITYLVGIDETFKNGDLGKNSFQKSFLMLTKGKDMLRLAADRSRLLPGEISLLENTKDAVFKIDVNEKRYKRLTYHNDQKNFDVIVNMYLVNPNQDFPDPNRADNYSLPDKAVEGMLDADVFIYDGHSGLGGYLSVGRLFTRGHKKLPIDKYQIFFFNGCSTFSYYNADYFDLKKVSKRDASTTDKIDLEGTKNLDIVTTSIGASFDIGAGNDSIFIRSLASGEEPSWQAIIDRIYNVEPAGSALTHVNGDEDNPKRPLGRCSEKLNKWQNPTSCDCQFGYKYHDESGYCRK